MIVPRHELLRHALVFDRRPEHHAIRERIDHAALGLLPRCLALRIIVAARTLKLAEALCEFVLRYQDVDAALRQIDTQTVAGLEHGQSAARCRFRRRVEDGRRSRRTRLPSVAEAWEGPNPRFT